MNISRLRRWFLVGAVALALLVAGAYLYAHWRLIHVAVRPPRKLDIEVEQTAQGFTISKSEQGRTIFTVRASNAVQYKLGGQAELHNVTITIYGRNGLRYDQIYGSDFQYNQQTGAVFGKGEVQIDLQANPAGLGQPDQTAPKELKDPIHLRTRNLVFNEKTGDAYTVERVDFQIPQATGSAVGAYYTAKEQTLVLKSQVNLVLAGPPPSTLNAASAIMGRTSREIGLDFPKIDRPGQHAESDHGTVYLRANNSIDHVIGTGNVHIQVLGENPIKADSDRGELFMAEQHNWLRVAVLSGNVHLQEGGPQPMEGTAGRLRMNFRGQDMLVTARASENATLIQHDLGRGAHPASPGAEPTGKPQDIQVSAPILDFVFTEGRALKSAVTSGAARILIYPASQPTAERTIVTADKFNATFDGRSRLRTVHGAAHAKIVNSVPGQLDRVSTSRALDVRFDPPGRVESIVQRGTVAYVDANLRAWGDHARYTPADQMLYLNGSPRVVEGGTRTTAERMRMNRATGDAYANGNVKSTYSDLKPQPDGALLASSDPIHVTSLAMVMHKNSGIATYTGKSRLWQNANVVEAPSIQFDRDRRSIVAHAAGAERVSTALVESGNKGKQTPVNVSSDLLTYTDEERKAHFEGAVVARSADATMTAQQADVYLKRQPLAEPSPRPSANVFEPSQLEKIIADGHIVIVQPNRRGRGEHLVYTADDDRYVLTGDSPSIFDAERGTVTGVSLTFYRRDDRVLVEGDADSPTVSQTRVAR